MATHFRAGDFVVYRKRKYSIHPSPHATGVCPAPLGDYYSYTVNKFWIVIDVRADQQVEVCTRRGKHLTVPADDPALRRAHWWERFLYRKRFPTVSSAE
jgi:hypothetical protein